MDLGIKLRLSVLGIAVGLTGALIVLATVYSERQAEDLDSRLQQVDSESFRIAEHFKDRLRDVNDKMRRYGIAQEPAAWADFLEGAHELDVWTEQQAPKLTTQHEKDVLLKIHAAYKDYLQRAQDLRALMKSAGEGASLAEFNSFLEQSRRVFDLGQALGRAHFESRNHLKEQAGQILSHLRRAVLVLVALLFVFVVVLAASVFRHLIAPLRVKLVESQALAERQEKLASLGVLAAGVAHEIRNPLTAIKTALFLQQKSVRRDRRSRRMPSSSSASCCGLNES